MKHICGEDIDSRAPLVDIEIEEKLFIGTIQPNCRLKYNTMALLLRTYHCSEWRTWLQKSLDFSLMVLVSFNIVRSPSNWVYYSITRLPLIRLDYTLQLQRNCVLMNPPEQV
jgi:hypothetical protein